MVEVNCYIYCAHLCLLRDAVREQNGNFELMSRFSGTLQALVF